MGSTALVTAPKPGDVTEILARAKAWSAGLSEIDSRADIKSEATANQTALIVMSGQSRGLELAYRRFERYVVHVLVRERIRVRTVLCVEPTAPPLSPDLKRRLRIVLEVRHEHASGQARLEDCWHASWATRDALRPSFFVRARPDQLWSAELAPLAAMGNVGRAVSARARFFSSAGHDTLLTQRHFSWLGPRCCMRGCSAPRRCVAVDDQWAIVPPVCAEPYFTQQPPAQVSTQATRALAECDRCATFTKKNEANLTRALVAWDCPLEVVAFDFQLNAMYGKYRIQRHHEIDPNAKYLC